MSIRATAEQDNPGNLASLSALLGLIEANHTFVVTSHTRPDGDAVGSSLGMYHLLQALGKDARVCFADAIPSLFDLLPGVEHIRAALPMEPPDVAILLECDSVARSGFNQIPARLTVNVDHHLSGRRFADFNWIDPEACAVGAMIYDLIVASGVGLTAGMASCLYTAILTDTGSFTFPSTDARTFEIARHLLASGAAAAEIAQAVYYSVPPSKIRLLAAALGNMRMEDEVAWSSVSQAEIDHAAATAEDCEGVVNLLIGMAGVRAAVFLREALPGNQVRLSLRSKGAIDVAAVAEQFGGGGHRNASGCTLEGPLASALRRVLPELQHVARGAVPEARIG